MNLRQITHQLYCDFVIRFHHLQGNDIALTQKQREVVVDFLIDVHIKVGLHSVGSRYIFDFLLYQFNYWCDKKVKFGDRITVRRVFGKASRDRWFSRPDNFSWYNAYKNMDQYNINLSMLSKYHQKKIKDHTKISIFEENEKRRFHNQPQGLRNCLEQTTLYNHKSQLCLTCKLSQTCKQLLKQNYPAIFIDRRYD